MKRGSRDIGNGEGISIIASRHVRHRYRIFQNFRPVAIVAKSVDEQKKLGGGSEQYHSFVFSALAYLLPSNTLFRSTAPSLPSEPCGSNLLTWMGRIQPGVGRQLKFS